ncbi:CPBP family intramembrane glutamic endopeptidase [Mesoterricola sediminis]|uniref:CPBP family intramembrane glutamic endopeptidase n=1 Tax=Mesoterricola sediminis TaxID=2927980 RepID=UPI001FAFA28D|nr:CPBP family intramembrane glutamic endopeptidase [Mesoterricola sediminis]
MLLKRTLCQIPNLTDVPFFGGGMYTFGSRRILLWLLPCFLQPALVILFGSFGIAFRSQRYLLWYLCYPVVFYLVLALVFWMAHKGMYGVPKGTFGRSLISAAGAVLALYLLSRWAAPQWPCLANSKPLTDFIEGRIVDSAEIPKIFVLSGFLISMLIGPIVEELYFRRMFLGLFNGKIFYCLGGSIIFAMAHVSSGNIVMAFFLGICLSLVYLYSGKIWISCVLHSVFNFLVILK